MCKRGPFSAGTIIGKCQCAECRAVRGEIVPPSPTDPAHYRQLPMECIEVTEHFSYCLGNAIKYIWRVGSGTPDRTPEKNLEDLQKAIWYLTRQMNAECANMTESYVEVSDASCADSTY